MKKTLSPLKNRQIEYQLLPRLQTLGWMLLGFGCIAFVYSFLMSPINVEEAAAIQALQLEEVETSGPALVSVPQLKPEIVYLGISSFWIVGTACIIFAYRKKKRMP